MNHCRTRLIFDGVHGSRQTNIPADLQADAGVLPETIFAVLPSVRSVVAHDQSRYRICSGCTLYGYHATGRMFGRFLMRHG